jgi:hypothetical protein
MRKEGGISIVPCKVNGLVLEFIFDTGAADVSLSLTEVTDAQLPPPIKSILSSMIFKNRVTHDFCFYFLML